MRALRRLRSPLQQQRKAQLPFASAVRFHLPCGERIANGHMIRQQELIRTKLSGNAPPGDRSCLRRARENRGAKSTRKRACGFDWEVDHAQPHAPRVAVPAQGIEHRDGETFRRYARNESTVGHLVCGYGGWVHCIHKGWWRGGTARATRSRRGGPRRSCGSPRSRSAL